MPPLINGIDMDWWIHRQNEEYEAESTIEKKNRSQEKNGVCNQTWLHHHKLVDLLCFWLFPNGNGPILSTFSLLWNLDSVFAPKIHNNDDKNIQKPHVLQMFP